MKGGTNVIILAAQHPMILNYPHHKSSVVVAGTLTRAGVAPRSSWGESAQEIEYIGANRAVASIHPAKRADVTSMSSQNTIESEAFRRFATEVFRTVGVPAEQAADAVEPMVARC